MARLESAGCDLDVWLTPFLAALGRKTRRAWAPVYVRGLLGPSERKSLQPMALRLGLGGHDQLQHFICRRRARSRSVSPGSIVGNWASRRTARRWSR
jgi:SRSO17 transposase